MATDISIAFFGSSTNSLAVLKSLKEAGFKIALMVTAPPRPVGRKKTLTKTPPHIFAKKGKIPVLSPDKLNGAFLREFQKSKLDVAVVADYARLIPRKVLDHPKRGFLNLHPSLLPKYRGSSPGEMAILLGDKVAGMSVIKMDEQFDHGPIISQFKEEIQADDTAEALYRRLFAAGSQVLTSILPAWVEGRIQPREQDHAQASYAHRLTRDDGFIPWKIIQQTMRGESFDSRQLNPRLKDFWDKAEGRSEGDKFAPSSRIRQSAWKGKRRGKISGNASFEFKRISVALTKFVERAIRAFSPWPGVWTNIAYKAGMKRLKLLSAHLEGDKLVLDRVQLEGKKPSAFTELQSLLA